jgi:hypothetical protein
VNDVLLHRAVAALIPDSEETDDGGGPYVSLPASFVLLPESPDDRAMVFLYEEDGYWRYQLAGVVVEISVLREDADPAAVVAWVTQLTGRL